LRNASATRLAGWVKQTSWLPGVMSGETLRRLRKQRAEVGVRHLVLVAGEHHGEGRGPCRGDRLGHRMHGTGALAQVPA
jgi:hypothetical protein